MNERNTLQYALGPFLVLAQFFGIFPVSGIWPNCVVANVHFYWLNPKMVLTGGAYLFALIDLLLSARLLLFNGLKIYTIGSLSFSVICLFCFGSFLSLCRKWPQLAHRTAHCELIFQKAGYRNWPMAKQFSHRLRIWGICLTLAALCEHLTYVGSAVYGNYMQIHECNFKVDFWQNYFQRERNELFSIMEYNVWIIPFLEWTTLSMTFVWSFVDIFLILMCRSLEMRFRQFHWHLKQQNWHSMSNKYWHNIRSDLLELSDLFRLYDKHLSGLFLCSCAHNMYFICVQIYHSFQAKGGFMDELYFWFCLCYVICRILNMMFAASSIPQEAKQITFTLYEVPTKYWCIELERLNEVFRTEIFAFSSKGFFYMTRRLIFAMAATLMVYELVLVNQMAGSEVQKSICSRGAGSSMSIFYS